jgi:hypothetical protein
MSTRFGIYIPAINKTIEIAHRSNKGNNEINIEIKNPLVYLLPGKTKIESLDNTPQGIYTIKDLLLKT